MHTSAARRAHRLVLRAATLRVVVSLRPSGWIPAPTEERSILATFAPVGQRPVPVELPTVTITPPAR